MKTLFNIMLAILAASLLSGLGISSAQREDAAKEVEGIIRQYYKAMATRDVAGLRAALDSRFFVVESGRDNAKVHVVDTSKSSDLLPPEGNDDWQNLQISQVKVEVSSTHPSVAAASFIVTHPLDAEKITALEDALKSAPPEFEDSHRKAAAKLIADRGSNNAELAMLARRDGRWKIVTISVPD
ncbi:MAG TPA: hypothetical protein PK640_16500 [Verrucomicrobiota bacterium]|nr:hypothetical protein [Verrucomicrobiota bacterium]